MPPRILFVGMRCEFSRITLKVLLASGVPISAVIIPPRGPRPSAISHIKPDENLLGFWPEDVVNVAQAARVPVWEVNHLRAPETLAWLESLQPEALVCACFPRHLPQEWLTRLKVGGLNLHPSLLPAYRGPAPLFWQFRNGEINTGVTLHVLDEDFDTGPIVAQAAVPLADGVSEAEAERLMAQTGAQLLIHALTQAKWPRHPQANVGVSYAPYPTGEDLVIPTHWPARRAFNFARGAETRGPLTVMIDGRPLLIKRAVSFSESNQLTQPVASSQNLVQISFAPGQVLFEVA